MNPVGTKPTGILRPCLMARPQDDENSYAGVISAPVCMSPCSSDYIITFKKEGTNV